MPTEIMGPREAPGSLVDQTLLPWRPVTAHDWVVWHERRDNAWLALHRAAMVRFGVHPTWYMPGGLKAPTHMLWLAKKARMDAAIEWLHDLVYALGLDPDTEALFEHRWTCPKDLRRQPPPRHVFAQAGTAVVKAGPGPRRRLTNVRRSHGDDNGAVDLVLVDMVINSRKPARLLNDAERAVAAGCMARDGAPVTRIANLLHVHNHDVALLLTEYESTRNRKELIA